MADGPTEAGQRDLLARLIEEDRIDTVLCVLTDLWGRLVGKRLTARTFRDTFLHQDGHTAELGASLYLFCKIRNSMDQAGISVSGSKGEWGLGQHEVNLHHADALEMADRHAIYKNGVKEMVAQEGWSATFMAKWSPDEVGSSFHLHSSV